MKRILHAILGMVFTSTVAVLHGATTAEETGTGFEDLPAGAFESIDTPIGTFTRVEGPVRVETAHARTGDRCLQLAGPKSVVELSFADGETAGALTFHAERWTAREPWSFRIESFDGEDWHPLRDASEEVVVGRSYKSFVRLPLTGSRVEGLRFIVESPGNTGVLLDDLRITPPMPQHIVSVVPVPGTLPVLVGRDSSPLARLAIEVQGDLDPRAVREVEVGFDGTTDRGDVEAIILRIGDSWDGSTTRTLLETPMPGAGAVILELPEGTATLSSGRNDLWVGCRLSGNVDIDHLVGAEIRSLAFADGDEFEFKASVAPQRLGVALRQGGQDGIHTARIPGIVTTNAGTLVAVYDNRRAGGHDLPGDIDVGMSRSTDGGRTWSPMSVIMDMGDDPAWRGEGIGDPAILVDRGTGTIWVAALWSHGDRGWHGSGPGLAPEETGQFMLARSDDDGLTWSVPSNITAQVKDPAWSLMLQGPGKGITMSDGTLVFPAQFRSSPATGKVPHSTLVWSKDHGRTWHAGTGAFPHTTESQLVEVEPGVIMSNCRYDEAGVRVVMTTRDLGKTWAVHPTSRRSLTEPRACMASLIEVDRELGTSSRGRLLFSNPDHPETRRRIMIKASTDGGRSWPTDRRVLLDTGRSAGYSCMTMIDADTVGILYECSQSHLAFQRIPLAELFPTDIE